MPLRRYDGGSGGRPINVRVKELADRSCSDWKVLIIADIIMTITIDPTVESALTLGVIVLVRTFLSFSLEIELTGTLPWRRPQGPSNE